MANPIIDPTTEIGKDHTIQKLNDEITALIEVQDALVQRHTAIQQSQDKEIAELKDEIVYLKRALAAKQLMTSTLPAAQPPPTAPSTSIEFEPMDTQGDRPLSLIHI